MKKKKITAELIYKSFPFTFGFDPNGKEPRSMFGLEVGKGWYESIYRAAEKLEPLIVEQVKKDPKSYADGYWRTAQLKEKYGCYDEKTEVLTEEGWKFFKDITYRDKIATLEEGQYLKYYNPADVISYFYNGKMYHLKTRGVNLLVTPNHNLYVAKGSYYNGWYKPPKRVDRDFELTTPEKYFGKNKRFKKDTIWIGQSPQYFILPKYEVTWHNVANSTRHHLDIEKKINMKSWLEFLGFYVAEGSSAVGKDRGTATISCCNTDRGKEKDYTTKLIENIGYAVVYSESNKSSLNFRIHSKQLASWLKKHCGHLAENKKAPDFIKTLSPELIRYFLIGLYNGDGHKTPTANILSTVSKQLSDDVQELIFKVGNSSFCFIRKPRKQKKLCDGRIIQGKFDSYEINWLMKSADHNTQNKGLSKRASEEWVDYSGNVYCVTVPNHVIYVRREGIPVWCGNSGRWYLSSSTKAMDAITDAWEKETETTCETCGATGKLRGQRWYYTSCYNCSKPEDRII